MRAKKALGFFLLFILISSSAALADNVIYTTEPSNSYCINDTDSASEWTFMNDDVTPDTWETHMKNFTCANNCSATLDACRPLDPQQAQYSVILIVSAVALCLLGMHIRRQTPMLDFPLYILAAFLLILFAGGMDIFTASYRTMLLGFSLVPFGFVFGSIYYSSKSRREDRRGYSAGHE